MKEKYLSNKYIRIGLSLVLLGWMPLLGIIFLVAEGLWSDPNPNSVGPDLIRFKRIVFWLEVALTILLFCLGLFLVMKMLLSSSSNLLESITKIIKFTGELQSSAIEAIVGFPSFTLLLVFRFIIYVGSLFYFSQTVKEKKIIKYIIPLSLVAILLCAVGISALFLSAALR
jgi:uncharacterized membrane protein